MKSIYSNDEVLTRLITAFELYIYYKDNENELNKIFGNSDVIESYFILLLGYNYTEYYLLDDENLNNICCMLQERKDNNLPFTYKQERLNCLLKTFLNNENIDKCWKNRKSDKTGLVKVSIWNSINKWFKTFNYFSTQNNKDEIQVSSIELKPQSLITERAKTLFNKAINLGYLERTKTGYKSRFKSKALLAYFLECVYCKDNNGKDNGLPFPETRVNNLFNETRLGKARGQYINNKNGKPTGYKIIEELIK